jgi:hypothetical protein
MRRAQSEINLTRFQGRRALFTESHVSLCEQQRQVQGASDEKWARA